VPGGRGPRRLRRSGRFARPSKPSGCGSRRESDILEVPTLWGSADMLSTHETADQVVVILSRIRPEGCRPAADPVIEVSLETPLGPVGYVVLSTTGEPLPARPRQRRLHRSHTGLAGREQPASPQHQRLGAGVGRGHVSHSPTFDVRPIRVASSHCRHPPCYGCARTQQAGQPRRLTGPQPPIVAA
jgi:hypothetical protein